MNLEQELPIRQMEVLVGTILNQEFLELQQAYLSVLGMKDGLVLRVRESFWLQQIRE